MPVQYRGFSTVYNQGNKKYTLTGTELIKQDLLNAINTRKGSRVMQANEGTTLWDMVFEPITEQSKAALAEDLANIVRNDPRLSISRVDINSVNNSIYLTLDLVYVQEDMSDTMRIRFDSQTMTATFQ